MNTLKVSLLGCIILLTACKDDDNHDNTNSGSSLIQLKNHSITPNFLSLKSGFNDVEIYSLISSEDQLANSDFLYGSMADGAGLIKNEDGTYSFINNAEADYSVMRISLDETFKPTDGEYILNSIGTSNLAQCSGTLVMPEEHGFGPLYLSGGEWSNSEVSGAPTVFGINPLRDEGAAASGTMYNASMGEWTVENAVPLSKDAFPGKTIVLIGDDSHGDAGGQLAMFVSESVGDLTNGKLYALKMTNHETDNDLTTNQTYPIEFVELTERTFNELNAECIEKSIMAFNRVEDIDYRKGSASANREIYFNATGHNQYDDSRTRYGRTYRLNLNENDPLKGTLTLVLNGDDTNSQANSFTSPDNILVTENYAYIQEDPNGFTDDDGSRVHSAQLYQYNLNTGNLKTVLEIDQNLMANSTDRFGKPYAAADARQGANELTGMIDISDIIGVDNTFILMIQAHTWKNDAFLNPDKAGADADSSSEGSVAYIIQGLDR